MASKFSHFLAELKRRKVTRVAIAYVIIGIGLVEGADIIGSPLGLLGWVIPSLSLLVVIGFPLSLILAWAREVTPDGIQLHREPALESLRGFPPFEELVKPNG